MTPNIRDFNIMVTPSTEMCFNLGLKEHGDQVRKNSNLNYFLHHCCPVAEIATQIAPLIYKLPAYRIQEALEIITCTALLHDLAEDTKFQIKLLPGMIPNKLIGWQVQCNVQYLSRPNKDELCILGYLQTIKDGLDTKIVKLADLTHNMSDLKAGNLLDKYTLCYNFLLT